MSRRYVIIDASGADLVVSGDKLLKALHAIGPLDGLQVIPIRTVEASDEYAEWYAEYQMGYEPDRAYIDAAAWFKKLVPDAVEVLDVGCGSGKLQEKLEELGCRTVGVEVNAHALKRNKRLSMLYDGLNLPFPDDTFDAVVSMNIWEHLTMPQVAALTLESLRVAPEAVISLAIPDGNSPTPEARQSLLDADPTHKLAWTNEEWSAFFQGLDLEVRDYDVKVDGVGTYHLKRKT